MGSYIRKSALSHKDYIDRQYISEFLKDNGVSTKFGTKYGVDLEDDNFNAYEIENVSYNAISRFKKEGMFRIPFRKAHYWDGTDSYNSVHYFQFYNKDCNQFLLYPSKLIKKYVKNTVELSYLKWHGFSEKERTFISIPFDEEKHNIRHYIKNNNKFERVTIF
jgi:hypothetical protein